MLLINLRKQEKKYLKKNNLKSSDELRKKIEKDPKIPKFLKTKRVSSIIKKKGLTPIV